MNLKRNSIWSLGGAAIPLLAAAPAIPFLIRVFGTEAFGVLTLVWALIGYFSLFDFGVGRALTVELGRRLTAPHAEQAAVLKAGLQVVVLAGLLGAAVVYFAAAPLANAWLSIGPAHSADASAAFRVTAIGVLATTLASGLRGAMEGLNRFASSNINRMAAGLMQFSMPCVAVAIHGPSLFHACIYLVAARCGLALIAAYQLRAHLLGPGRPGRENYLLMLHFGAWATVSGVISPLMIYGDRFFVSAALGAAVIAFYAIPQEGLQRLLMLPNALCAALLARLPSLPAGQALSEYRRNLVRVAMWHGAVCASAAVLAFPVFRFWISADFAATAIGATLVLCLGIWINGIALVPYTLLHAQGNSRTTALFHLGELFFYAAAVWWLTTNYGIIGAAWAWTIRATADFLLLLQAAGRWGTASVLSERAYCPVANK